MNQAFRIGTGLSAQDEREIAAVLIAYASAIDQRDWRLLHSIFTYDCDVDYGSFGKWHGAKALTEHLNMAGIRQIMTEQNGHQRAFAGTVFAQQSQHFALL